MSISQELLTRIVLDQHEKNDWPKEYIPRTIEPKLARFSRNKEIIVLAGVRRCGKSVLLEHERRRHEKSNDFHFNFEDERLVTFGAEDFELLHQVLITLYGVQTTFYFDEIQNIPSWELFVRRMYNSGCKIYLTGSNANLFSEELGTRLTGRYIELQVYPISFAEFSQNVVPLEKQHYSTTDIGLLKESYNKYSELGGIPAYLSNQEPDYLHSLYSSILYKDIVARYKISNPEVLKRLVFFLASNCGKEVTSSKLLNMINTSGTIVKSITTISDYCRYLENSFLCFFVHKYDDSLKVQQQAPRKIYFVDHALAKNIGFRISEDLGRLLENVVFIELKRRNFDIFYYKGNKECDFVLRSNMQTIAVIQVCIELADAKTKQREIAGLVEAMNRFGLKEGVIITMHEEYEEIQDINGKSYKIMVTPIWKWLRAKYAITLDSGLVN